MSGFEAWPAELQQRDVDRLDRAGLCDAAAWSARVRAGLDAFDARVAAAVEGLGDRGAGAATVFRSVGRCSQREADRRARRAETLASLPQAAEALAAGAVTAEHVDALARAVEQTSPEAVAGSDLLDLAARKPADAMAKDVRDWTRKETSQQALQERQRRQRAARKLNVFDNEAGMTVVYGEFDPVTGEEIRSAINTAADRLYHADGGRAGAAEVRTPEQRRADAFGVILGVAASIDSTAQAEAPVAVEPRDECCESHSPRPNRATRRASEKTARRTNKKLAGAGPPAVRNQVLLIAHADGSAEIPQRGPIPSSELERLMCIGDIYGLLFSGDGRPLWHGDRVRLATDDQWRGLIARDGGCVICDAAPANCEAHHLRPWLAFGARDGPTDIDNLALVCKHHHHLIHDLGYVLAQTDDGTWQLHPPN